MKLTFFGSSLVSAYWNGAATYYRGICKALHALGHDITFVEQDIYERQAHRDLATDPAYATVQVLDVAGGLTALDAALDAARAADWVFVCSGIGANDDYIQEKALALRQGGRPRIAFWDVDAPFNLTEAHAHPDSGFAGRIPAWDRIFTYGGGPRVVDEYTALGAQDVSPIYNAVDPEEYYPVPLDPDYACDLLLMANRMPDREARIWDLFIGAATRVPDARFALGGSGWDGAPFPPNVETLGHVPTGDHARRNGSARMVMNVNRAAMADYGYSPPTRIFEAAGNAACLITDDWPGIPAFLEPGHEILVARDASDIAAYLHDISWDAARAIGQAAHARVLRDHTYAQRAREVDALLRGTST
ncbi:MAG TPA: glycosyltransferase [Chloroflexia bacterium]|nr:glycosyltransferase [Chloroflexia bacterium]